MSKRGRIILLGGLIVGCAGVLAAAGLWLHAQLGVKKEYPGGVMRRYKDVEMLSQDVGIIWSWEDRTTQEKYGSMTFEGRVYRAKGSTEPSCLGAMLGQCEAVGYEEVGSPDGELKHYASFPVYQVQGIRQELMVAVEMDSAYYVFQYDKYEPPATFGEVLRNYSLAENLPLLRFSVEEGSDSKGYYRLEDDAQVWEILSACDDAVFVEYDPMSGYRKGQCVEFTATSKALGSFNKAFYVYESGILWTNVWNWAYVFDIGEEAAGEIFAYVTAAEKTAIEREPYGYGILGEITEIGGDYFLVNDKVMCALLEKDMTFRVSMDNIYVSRRMKRSDFEVGDTVYVYFSGEIDRANSNLINGVTDVKRASYGNSYGDGGAWVISGH